MSAERGSTRPPGKDIDDAWAFKCSRRNAEGFSRYYQMQFTGQLLLPGEPGPGLNVHLDVAAHHLAVESEGGGLGAWPLEAVEVARLQGDIFALTVAGESLHFVADDTIGFAYSGVPTIERVSSRSPRARSAIRSMLDRIWNGPDDAAPPGPAQEEAPDDVPPQRELHPTERPAGGEAAPDLEVPGVSGGESVEGEDVVAAPDPEVKKNTGGDFVEVEDVVEPRNPVEGEETIPLIRSGDETIPLIRSEPAESQEVWEETTGPADLDEVPYRSEDESIPLAGTDRAEPSAPADDPEASVCPAVREDGRPCESQILTASGYCYAHDPRRAFEDRYQAAQEARARLKRDATARLNRIYSRLDKAMRQVERGELDAETATAMAQLARTMCAILDLDESAAGDSL